MRIIDISYSFGYYEGVGWGYGENVIQRKYSEGCVYTKTMRSSICGIMEKIIMKKDKKGKNNV